MSKLDRKELRQIFESDVVLYSREVQPGYQNPFKVDFDLSSSVWVFLKNISPAYFANSTDVCRIQLASMDKFNEILTKGELCIPIGFDSENQVYVTWDESGFLNRLNNKRNVSLYSRYSEHKNLKEQSLLCFQLSDGQEVKVLNRFYVGEYLREKSERRKSKSNQLTLGVQYSKEEIYSIKRVPVHQRRGKWDKGYCEHNEECFIFANVGISGKGYSQGEYDYNNRFNHDGDFEWEAANGSLLRHPSVNKLLKSSPYIFVRDEQTEKNKWKYLGRGEAIEKKEGPPVYVKWRVVDMQISLGVFDDFKVTEEVQMSPRLEAIRVAMQRSRLEALKLYVEMRADEGKVCTLKEAAIALDKIQDAKGL